MVLRTRRYILLYDSLLKRLLAGKSALTSFWHAGTYHIFRGPYTTSPSGSSLVECYRSVFTTNSDTEARVRVDPLASRVDLSNTFKTAATGAARGVSTLHVKPRPPRRVVHNQENCLWALLSSVLGYHRKSCPSQAMRKTIQEVTNNKAKKMQQQFYNKKMVADDDNLI